MADTFRIDSTKIQFHPQRVAQWLDSGDDWEKAKKVYPIYAEITTSAACNHRCTFCSVDAIGYPQIMIDRDILQARLREMGRLGIKSVMFAGTGEPLLHKHIDAIVADARWAKLDIAFTTNGVLLHKLATLHYCSWVKISMNAGTRESYEKIHQTNPKDWDSIWKHLPSVLIRKGDCKVGIQCVVLPENYLEIASLALRSMESGVDYLVLKPYSQGTFSIVQRHDIDYETMKDELLAVRDNFSRDGFEVIYRANAINRESQPHQYDRCMATPFMWVYFMANGDVFTCSAHLMDQRFCIGNIYQESFQEIWEGDKRKQQWEMMKEFDIKQCRKNCRMESTNLYLDELRRGPAHGNFI